MTCPKFQHNSQKKKSAPFSLSNSVSYNKKAASQRALRFENLKPRFSRVSGCRRSRTIHSGSVWNFAPFERLQDWSTDISKTGLRIESWNLKISNDLWRNQVCGVSMFSLGRFCCLQLFLLLTPTIGFLTCVWREIICCRVRDTLTSPGPRNTLLPTDGANLKDLPAILCGQKGLFFFWIFVPCQMCGDIVIFFWEVKRIILWIILPRLYRDDNKAS